MGSNVRRALARPLVAALLLTLLASLLEVLPAGAQAAPITEVAFVRRNLTTGERAIWVINEDGTGAAQLSSGHDDGQPEWSPDGGRIAFGRATGEQPGLYVMNADGSSPVRVAGDATAGFPTWSPDGTRIAYSQGGTGFEDIFVVDLATGAVSQLTSDPVQEFAPTWSPDGARIAFTKDTDGTPGSPAAWRMWDMAADGTGQRQLTDTPSVWGEYSPDGTSLAYTRDIIPQKVLIKSPPDPSGGETLVDTTASAAEPSWSPDGTRLAVGSGGAIDIVTVADASATQLTSSPDGDFSPDWQPRPAQIRNLTIDVKPASGPAGISAIDPASIDIGTLPLLNGELASAPLRSSPLRSSPLRSSPLRSSPLRSSPLRSSPLRSSPLRSSPLRSSPLRSSPLRSSPFIGPMPLSAVPLADGYGWAPRLAGPVATPYAGLPLQSVTLQQVLALDPATYPQLADLTLADIDLRDIPLRSSSLQAFLFAGPTLQQLSSTTAWCTAIDCTATDPDIDPTVHTLTDVELGGIPTSQLGFVADLPVKDADLGGSVVAGYDVASVDVALTPFGATPADDPRLTDVIDCSVFDCDTGTLADAVAVENSDADLDVIRQTATLGTILADDGLVGSMTFGDLVRALVDPARLSYADIALEHLLTAAPIATSATYQVSFDVRCDDADDFLNVAVSLPESFRYVPGSGQYAVDGGTPTPAEPFQQGDVVVDEVAFVANPELVAPTYGGGATPPADSLQWSVAGVSCAGTLADRHVDLWLDAQSGAELGTFTTSVLVLSESTNAGVTGAPFGVEEAFEPNGEDDPATAIQPNVLYLSHIGTEGDVDRFQLPAQPEGSVVTAVVSHVPADFDLFVTDGPVSAPLRSSPLRSSPLRSSPLEDDGLDGQGLPAGGEGEVIPPDTLQDVPLRSSPLRSSTNRGTESEIVSTVIVPGGGSEPVTLAVAGYNGASSHLPYLLQVFVEGPPQLACPPSRDLAAIGAAAGRTGSAGAVGTLPNPTSLDPATRTLFLLNTERSGDLHGAEAVAAARARLDGGDGPGGATGLGDRPEVAGAVLSIDADPAVAAAYAAWDDAPCSVEAVNDVVLAIDQLLAGYLAELPDVEYVTILGGDDEIPHARVPDLVTLSNQRDYFPEVRFDNVDNPISAAFAQSHGLTDNAYGAPDAFPWLDHAMLVPKLATGRLVETPADWIGAVDQYESSNGTVSFDGALTTGYDFLADGAAAVDATLSAVASSARSLISGDVDPAGDDWDRDALRDELEFGPDVAMVGAHFDHSNLLPAKGDTLGTAVTQADLFSTEDLGSVTNLPPGFVLFSPGCNAGINVPDHAFVGATAEEATRLVDFAQSLAQRGASGLTANLGFGYGDTAAVAFSERLLDLYAQRLAAGSTLGKGLLEARELYLNELGLPGVYDEKVATQATFYGFPFTQVVGAAPVAASAAVIDEPTIAPDDATGIPAAAFDADLSFQQVTTQDGSYHLIPGSQPLIEHYRPVQPMTVVPLPDAPTATELGDVWFTGLTSSDVNVNDPAYVRPRADESRLEPEPDVVDVAFPAALYNVTFGGDLALLPGSFRSDGSGTGSGSQRLYGRVAGKVFYPSTADTRPAIAEVEALELGGATAFRAEIAGEADEVVAWFQSPGVQQWSSVGLARGSSDTWTGVTDQDVAEFFIQARKGGFVGYARGKGLNYVPTPVPPVDPTTGPQVTFDGTDVGGWFTGAVTVNVFGEGGPYTVGVDGGEAQPAPVTVTGDGVHVLAVLDDGNLAGHVLLPIDTTGPTVTTIDLSANPIAVGTASTTVSAVVSDLLSGVAGGEVFVGTDPGQGHATSMSLSGGTLTADLATGSLGVGVHTIGVRARDVADNWGPLSTALLVVYDASGGFVTGGGWIASPAGAYTADPSLTGKANFGFVSKYERGAKVPSGTTEFGFTAGNLSFYSDTYQWLVVSGARAQYKGTGTLNGEAGYGFLLTAVDGHAVGGGGVDRFRIRIWELATDRVVYDNGLDAGDDSDPQPISSGSIVVHAKKK